MNRNMLKEKMFNIPNIKIRREIFLISFNSNSV